MGFARGVRLWPLALALVAATPARAQPPGGMPDLRAMSGRPLTVPQLPAGTVTVRLARQLPMNPAPDIEVTAIVVAPDGESRKRVAKSGSDGRATFEGLRAGSSFQASVTIDGERLQTAKFSIPAEGGTRIMLIAGLGKAPPAGQGDAPPEATADAPPAGEERFALGAVTGSVSPVDDLPIGTLVLSLVAEDGKPIVGRAVQLGQVGSDNQVKVLRAVSDAGGAVRFDKLPTGEQTGYAAVIVHGTLRLGTEAFRMPHDKGARGSIRALARTNDFSVLRIGGESKLIFEVGEDSVQMMEQLFLKNVSDKIFDSGPEGVLIPLPANFEGGRDIQGNSRVEVRDGDGAVFRGVVPPSAATMFAPEVRVGFVVLAHGSASVEVRQKLPFGIEKPLLLVPASANLTLSAPELRALPDRTDANGNVVKIYEHATIAPGGTLAVTVNGLPALSNTGRNVAAGLCLLLIAGAVVASRRPRREQRPEADARALAERREKLFSELTTVELARRRAAGSGKPDPDLERRRQELVGKLETVYRELSNVEHESGATL